jgi:hypothetical protein
VNNKPPSRDIELWWVGTQHAPCKDPGAGWSLAYWRSSEEALMTRREGARESGRQQGRSCGHCGLGEGVGFDAKKAGSS